MAAKVISLQRVLTATPQEAYRAFTSATAMREWLCDVATLDARKGGRLYLAWHTGLSLSGAYTALVAGKKVAFSVRAADQALPAEVTVALSNRKGKTVLAFTETSADKQWAKQIADIEAGWRLALDNLQSVLETGQDLRIIRRPMLGIDGFVNMNAEAAAKLGVPVSAGIHLDGVLESMGAYAAGLRAHDVIVSINGKRTPNDAAFVAIIQGYHAGDTVKVTYYRGAEKMTVPMMLSARPVPQVPASPQELADALCKVYTEWDARLEQCFEGVTEAETSHSSASGEWSAKEVLAHLIIGERGIQAYIEDLVGGEERWADSFGGNVHAHTRSVVAVHNAVPDLLDELKRSEVETVAFVALLPPEFVAHKGSYWRLGFSMLQPVSHTQDHISQIQAAIADARKGTNSN